MADYIDLLIAWEQGELSKEKTISLFQTLIDNGLVWKLQGFYGRTAKALVEAGYCTLPKGN